jgi:uncharacterized protein DUF6745
MTPGQLSVAWLARLLSTEPADRVRAETAVRDLYVSAGFAGPRHLWWFDSPFAASWAVALLIEPHSYAWRPLIDAERRSRQGRTSIEEAEGAIYRLCGVDSLAAAQQEMGPPLGSLQFPPHPNMMLLPKLVNERMALHGNDVSAMAALPSESDPVHRAEQRLWVGSHAVLESGLICHPVGRLITNSFFNDYQLSRMAADQAATIGREAPPILRACWELADAASVWWPFFSGAILAERPLELHVDENHFLHREDGAAAVYRDGWHVYAWHGLAVPEDWILHPEAIPPAKLRGFDASFRRFAESRRGKGAAPRRDRPSALLAAKLPTDAAERLQSLMAHAGAKLPLYERYAAGEHAAVWSALVAHGASVRSDPLAADALAVAYETMSRVDANIRTVVARLAEIGFEFTTPDGARRRMKDVHAAPDARTAKKIQRFEKAVGPLPLSIRTFYEVVGSVDLIGRHPSLAPSTGPVAPDPLVVIGIDEALSSVDDEEEGGLILAPDDLHKSNVSGGDPYEIGVPDPAADARVLNERHDLLFVDYLRLCFSFGGFPGYDGQTDVPPEIELLRSGLLEF